MAFYTSEISTLRWNLGIGRALNEVTPKAYIGRGLSNSRGNDNSFNSNRGYTKFKTSNTAIRRSERLAGLTPGHFLIGESLQTYPEENLKEVPINRLSRWQYVEKIRQQLWSR